MFINQRLGTILLSFLILNLINMEEIMRVDNDAGSSGDHHLSDVR